MNTGMIVDVDPLSTYETQYEYHPPQYYQPPLQPQEVAPYMFKEQQGQQQENYPHAPVGYPTQLPQEPTENYVLHTNEGIINDPYSIANPTSDFVEEEDIKPNIAQLEAEVKKRRKSKAKGKTSSYWNKKITDKDFAFYGCSVCNVAYTDLQELDQHVIIHTNRLTSYDLRLINLKKRKRLRRLKKKLKKDSKVKQEDEIEIKPEDGYIGMEKASEHIEKYDKNKEKDGFVDMQKASEHIEKHDKKEEKDGDVGMEKASELSEKHDKNEEKDGYVGVEKAFELNEKHDENKAKDGHLGMEKASELNEKHDKNKENDGHLGMEKASELNEKHDENEAQDDKDVKNNVNSENNENSEESKINPMNKSGQNYVNVYKCFGCNKQFALSYYLRIHVRSHTDEKPYTCSECGQRFITASKMSRHKKRIHFAVRHQCRICYKIFSRFELLVKHFDSKHPDDKLEGEPYDYNAILPYLKELEEQLKVEKEKKPKMEDPWVLQSAVDTAYQSVPVEAKEEIFVTKQEDKITLPANTEFFDENKDNPSEISNVVIINKVEIEFEIKQEVDDECDEHTGGDHHGDEHSYDEQNLQDGGTGGVKNENRGPDEEYAPSQTWVRPHSPLPKKKPKTDEANSCTICDKTFTKKSSLKNHIKSHTGDKPFICTICKRTYSTAINLKRHMLIHDNARDAVKDEDKKEVKLKQEPESVNTEVDDEAAPQKVKDGSESDEEYFPSKTWARPPSPSPSAPAGEESPRRSKTTCKICNKTLCSKTYLAVHMRTHTGERPFSCYICDRGFITASKMHRHVLTHAESWNGKDKIKSEDGAKVKLENEGEEKDKDEEKPDHELVDKVKAKLFLKKSKKAFFEQKKNKCNKKWTHVCEFCNQRFLHLETLQVHKKSHSDTENMKCYYCLEPHTEQETLKAHEATHTGAKPYVCTLCGHQYTKRGPMIYHRKKCKGHAYSDEGKKYLCEFCNKAYNAHSKLQRHLAIHSVAQYSYRYECPVCAHMFHTRYHVRMHLRYHIKEGTILEENRNSVLAMVLQNARKIPKGSNKASAAETPAPAAPPPDTGGDERSRICNICGQIFQHFYYLEEHLKTHGSKMELDFDEDEDEKKHTCQVCSKSFKLPYYLKLHSYTHTKEKPYICQQCGKGFITKGKLKRHLETHQGLKKYQCHVCYKFFTRPSYLRIHVRTIHGTQDYNCRDYGFGLPIGMAQD